MEESRHRLISIQAARLPPRLVVVDYYSKFPEIDIPHDKTSKSVIASLKRYFLDMVYPKNYAATTCHWQAENSTNSHSILDIKLTTSSSTYTLSYGMTERAVQTGKQILRMAEDNGQDPYIALLDYRNSHVADMTL